jgi:hypothetical protein
MVGSKYTLTVKQKAWLEAYLSNGFNATRAALAAGYRGSDHTLRQIGHENSRKFRAQIEAVFRHLAMKSNEALAGYETTDQSELADFLEVQSDAEGKVTYVSVNLGEGVKQERIHVIKKIAFSRTGELTLETLQMPILRRQGRREKANFPMMLEAWTARARKRLKMVIGT